MRYAFTSLLSPVGLLKLIASDKGLVAVLWPNDNPRRVPVGEPVEDRRHPILGQAEQELRAYFAGKRSVFAVPLDFRGTDFQKRVWAALLKIPYGETRSYKQIAETLGDVAATRAVGAANGKNPISIIAPCHRVIGASGKLTGFAGGLETKAWLLSHEGHEMNRAAYFRRALNQSIKA